MKFSQREHILINQLSSEYFISGITLAKEMQVSPKTIYRMIKKINDVVSVEIVNEELILSETGKGYRLNSKLITKNIFTITEENTNNSRKDEILLKLLFRAPFKLKKRALFKEYYLSSASIERDIRQIDEYLQKFSLYIQNPANEIWIVGNEANIRKCINDVITENGKNEDRFRLQESLIDINKYDYAFLVRQIEQAENSLDASLNYPYNINLFTHIYMLIKRYREGVVDSVIMAEELLDSDEQSLIKEYENVYQVATNIIKQVEGYIVVKMPIIEIFYLFQLLLASRFTGNQVLAEEECKLAKKVTAYYIEQLILTQTDSISIVELFNDLVSHIAPMLLRVQQGINIENALLEDVQVEYKQTYQLITTVSDEVVKIFQLNNSISKEENAYLTLYFEKYYVKQKEKNEY